MSKYLTFSFSANFTRSLYNKSTNMKSSKYIEDSDDEGDKEFKPTKRAQSDDDDDEEEFEEDTKEVKKPKHNKAEKAEKSEKSHVVRDTNGNQYFELSNKRRVTVSAFSSGEPAIHIREVYKDKNTGEMRPGKAGVTLPIGQWTKLKELIPDVEEAIKALKK